MLRKGFAGSRTGRKPVSGRKKGQAEVGKIKVREPDIYAGLSKREIYLLGIRAGKINDWLSSFSNAERKLYLSTMRNLKGVQLSLRVEMAEMLSTAIVNRRTYSTEETSFFNSMLSSFKGNRQLIVQYIFDLNSVIMNHRLRGGPLINPEDAWSEPTPTR